MSNTFGLTFAVSTLAILCGCAAPYNGPASSHFDGTRFFNPEGESHSFANMVKWLWEMETVAWPSWVEDPAQPRPVERVGPGELRVTLINHATVLIQLDPPTVERLMQRDHPRFIVGLGVAARLKPLGVSSDDIAELDWWQEYRDATSGTRFVFVPARHGSGRGPFSENRTLWGGFVIAAPDGEIYVAGDSGYGSFVDEIAARFHRIRLALLPIGSYQKRWFMKTQHMNPADAVAVHQKLRALQSMGIHYGTFAEHPEQSIDAHEKDLAAALSSQAIEPSRFWIPAFGEGRNVRRLDSSP